MGFVEQQLDVSRRVYGIDPASLQGRDRGRYVWDMCGAAHEECSEIRRCFDAKPWLNVTGETRVSHDEVGAELADLLVFLSNLAIVEGFTTETLLDAFEAKLRENEARHEPQPHRVGA